MKRLVLPASLALLASCATTTKIGVEAPVTAAPVKEKKDDKDNSKKIDELESKLDIARAKHEVAVLEAASYDAKHEARMRHATADVAMAEAKLATFREVDKPSRVASQTLSLQTARDRAQEALDELAQVEIMYAEQDLNDMTREFVIQRERRAADRANKRIEIQETQFRKFKDHDLPQEENKLKLAVDKANTSLQAAERDGEIGTRQKAIAVQQAEDSVEKLEGELAELQKKMAEQETAK